MLRRVHPVCGTLVPFCVADTPQFGGPRLVLAAIAPQLPHACQHAKLHRPCIASAATWRVGSGAADAPFRGARALPSWVVVMFWFFVGLAFDMAWVSKALVHIGCYAKSDSPLELVFIIVFVWVSQLLGPGKGFWVICCWFLLLWVARAHGSGV